MTASTRILRLIQTLDPAFGGPVEGIRQWSEILSRRGVSTTVATLDAPSAPFLTSYPVKTVALGATDMEWRERAKGNMLSRFQYSPRYVPWLKQHAREYDAIFVHGLYNYSTLGARRALVGSDLNYYVVSHGSFDPWFRKHNVWKHFAKQILWPFSEAPLLKDAKAVLFTTEEEQRLAQNAFWPWKMKQRVIPYGTGKPPPPEAALRDAFRAQLPNLGERPYLLFLSRIHSKKGCDILLEAFAQCAEALPDVDLIIAGPDQTGMRAELEALASAMGIAGRVHWPGMMDGAAKWGAYYGADAFILPSHSENFGIVVAEALACGRPVLISDKVNIWREIKKSGAGIIETDTVEGATALIRRFYSLTPEEQTEMGTAAENCFSEHFLLEKVADDLIDLLQK